jgi:glycosyltransferase involved in cell wall biosynthesis
MSPGFLLVVSRWQPHKNVHSVVRAYVDLLEKGHDLPQLVLVGKPVKDFDDPQLIAWSATQYSDKILILQDLTDSELAYMYDHCLVNIVPSLFEGFGLSVLEAMKRKKFSLCHWNTATSEIAGESGMAIDMADLAAIQKAILHIISDPFLVKTLNQSADRRAHRFSWEETSSSLIKMYKDLLDA